MREESCTLIMLTLLMYHVIHAKINRNYSDIFNDSLRRPLTHEREPLQNSITTCLFISKREELKFINSTTSVSTVLFSTCSCISSLTEGSHLSFHRCHIYSTTADSLIHNNGGHLILHGVKLLNSISSSLVSSSSGKLTEVMDCSFKNILNVGGNFILNGNASGDILRDCLFENITVKGEKKGSLTERCDIEGTVMKDVERGIYGGIVSGGNEFGMRNCSLIRNFREGNSGTCSKSVTSNCSTSSRISLSTSTSYSFTDCIFAGCSSPKELEFEPGGALYLVTSPVDFEEFEFAQSLTITRCSFTDCSTSSFGGGGGAVFCYYSQVFHAIASNFTSCSGIDYGGAVYCSGISTDCLLSSLLFNNCSSYRGAGGLGQWSFNVSDDSPPCSSCSFINCSGTGSTSGGGGLLFCPSIVQSVSGCLFRKCSATWRGGGLFWNDIEQNSKICGCLFKDNTARINGHDVYIFYNGISSFNPFDSYCFTLTDQTDTVYTKVYNNTSSSNQTATEDSWLPYATPSIVTDTEYAMVRTVSETASGSTCQSLKTSKCTTLVEAYNSVTLTTIPFVNIFLLNTSHTKDRYTLFIDGYTTTITSAFSLSTLCITESFSGLFLLSVSGGSLLLSDFDISLQTSSAGVLSLSGGRVWMTDMIVSSSSSYSLSSSPFSITGGEMNIEKTEIHTFTLTTCPLFPNTSSLSLSASTIRHIRRESGDGSVFEIVESVPSFTLSGVSFTSCMCTAGMEEQSHFLSPKVTLSN